MPPKTADLCDEFDSEVRVAEPIFRDFGGLRAFCGRVRTVRVRDDNSLVRAALETDGQGAVLVVDGGGSLRCALVGDRLGQLAYDNGWSGIVVHGCVRDSADLGTIPIGLKALASAPRKSRKRGEGEENVPLSFAGVVFKPGDHLYADPDGIVVADRDLQSGRT